MIKTRETAGADERTPSHPEYFSWINNTNEGSTEKQTLINLRYFGWLKKNYGMQLDIYAWDAGNLDGAVGTYGGKNAAKLKKQFPHGYGRCAEFAKELGIRMGVWCGPDGFGNTPEEEQKRFDLMTGLARDYGFALFKIDTVCGELRPEKVPTFIRMMQEIRKTVPDFVLLNHRQNMGDAEPYATTFLWEGMETYVDVFYSNDCTAPHHRARMFTRGNVPGMQRLTEDHGVCISSSIDFFEDDLIYQAFGRSLILAPEIYGNPWLMRDDEQAHLARIYNLHAQYNDILVDGMELPESYGPSAVARGNDSERFIVTGNHSWRTTQVTVKLDEEIGLKPCDEVCVMTHHPYEKYIGTFRYGDTVTLDLLPFRAMLLHICTPDKAPRMLTNCAYEVVHETNGVTDRVKILASDGEIKATFGEPFSMTIKPFDRTMKAPVYLGQLDSYDVPEDAEELFEASHYAMDNDSMEYRSLLRSGDTKIPEVKAARDAFFAQKTYFARGCDSRFAFDGNSKTFFDGYSKLQAPWMMFGNDCLRVDFGAVHNADAVMFEYFDTTEPADECQAQDVPEKGDYSADLKTWIPFEKGEIKIVRHLESVDAVFCGVHNLVRHKGHRCTVTYPVSGDIRYFRMPGRLDRIYKVSLLKNGKEIKLTNAKITNILPSFRDRTVTAARRGVVRVPHDLWQKGCYLAVTAEGPVGKEGVYAAARIDGKPVGFPDRAPCYPSNAWETPPFGGEIYTYYLPVTEEMTDRDIEVTDLFMTDKNQVLSDVWLCPPNDEKTGMVLDI